MNFAFLIITLALVWTAVTGALSLGNMILGAIVGLAALWLLRGQIAGPKWFGRFIRVLALAGLFFYELVLSALRVAVLVLRPNMSRHLQPGIVAYPLSVTRDIEITLLANLITLTPGTLSVDVSDDRKTLFVHAISVPDKQALIRDIANGFESKILEVFE